MPPSWVSRRPALDSAFITRVLICLFWAICMRRCTLFFWRVFSKNSLVKSRYSGRGLLGSCGSKMSCSASFNEKNTQLLCELSRFSKSSSILSVSCSVFI